VATGVVFVAGYVVAIFAPEGSWIGGLAGLPLVAGALLLVIAAASAAAITAPRQRSLAVGAIIAAVGCAVAVAALVVLSLLVETQQLPLEGWFLPIAIVASACGGAAIAALALALRARGFARRTALVVAVLGGVTLLGCFVIDPVAPYLLAAVLGVPLARSTASATM
jgi:hypothetical protein